MKRWDVIDKFSRKHGWKKGAEIGVYEGKTFFYLMEHTKLSMIGVDRWEADHDNRKQDQEAGLSMARKEHDMIRFANSVKSRAANYGSRATIYHMDSLAAAKLVPDHSLDFVFIDAEHTTEAVLSDVRAWAPKVVVGGWIMGHDEQWPSVQRALKQLFPSWEVHPDNVWAVEKC